jgi:hypothetical protein
MSGAQNKLARLESQRAITLARPTQNASACAQKDTKKTTTRLFRFYIKLIIVFRS